MVSISVILPTARGDYPIVGLPNIHMFQPTIESLKIQKFKDFELIVVDAIHHFRPKLFHGEPFHADKLPFHIKHVPIEHNSKFNHRFWMDHRKWNVCGTLNTGIIRAKGELLVRIDDCSEFGSDYLKKFWEGYESGYWPCAMHIRYLNGKPARLNKEYRKKGYEYSTSDNFGCKNVLEPNRDEILSKIYGENGLVRDTRYNIVKKEGGKMVAPYDWYYGYSSVSLDAALKVNGYNELFDGDKSLEDVDMGSRLDMAGYKNKFVLDINHQVIEHEHGPVYKDLIDQRKPIKCVHPDTIVICNGKPIKIKEIEEDMVVFSNGKLIKTKELIENKALSDTGTYQKIKSVLKRDHNGEIIKIVPYYTNIPLIISPEHAILVGDKDKNTKWIEAENIKTTDYLLYPRLKEYKYVESIKISSYIYPSQGRRLINGKWYLQRNQHGQQVFKDEIFINSEFMRLIGYYLGEGSATESTGRQINFSFNDNEEDLIYDVVELMNNIFGINPTSLEREKTAHVIRYNSTILTLFFKELFGGYSNEKRLPPIFICMNNDLTKELIKSLYLSEGITKDPDYGNRGGYYQLNTSSVVLAYQLVLLFNKIGIPAKIWKREPNSKNFSIIEGRKIIPKSTMYYIQIPNQYGNMMEDITGITLPIDLENRREYNFNYPINFVDDNFIYVNIRKISKEIYNGELYNLEVEGETYTANGIIVHNCNHSIYLINRKKNRWKANSSILSKDDIEFIRKDSLKPPCSPKPNFYDEDCNGKWFNIWLKNQPIFDLRKERDLIK